jgi:hypothetical protein
VLCPPHNIASLDSQRLLLLQQHSWQDTSKQQGRVYLISVVACQLYTWEVQAFVYVRGYQTAVLIHKFRALKLPRVKSVRSCVNVQGKARPVDPEKQPLLANGSETTIVCRQRLGKYVPAATDAYATI